MIRAGYGYDLSALLDDDEERRRAEEAAAGVAPPDPPVSEPVEAPPELAPATAQPSAPEPNDSEPDQDTDDPFAGLADIGAQNPVADLPPPPERQKPDEGPAALGLALDLFLNKGRHVGQMISQFGQPEDTDYENWKRKLEWAKARAGRSGAMNPYNLALRRAELQARMRGLTNQEQNTKIRQAGQQTREAAQATREADQARKHSATDPRTRATQDWIIAHAGYADDSPDAARVRQMDDTALGRVMTGLMKDAATREGAPLAAQDTAHAAEKAGAVSDKTLPNRLLVAETLAHARGEESRLTGIAGKATTREIGEAEMNTTLDAMNDMLSRRDSALLAKTKGAIGGLVGARGAMLPDEAAYNSAKQALINSAEKMVTMGVPHAEAVRSAAESLPHYTDAGAVEQLQSVRSVFNQMAASGGAAIERAKDEYGPPGSGNTAPAPRKQAQPARRKTAKQLADEGWQ